MADIDQDILNETNSQSDGEQQGELAESLAPEPEGSDIASETGLGEDPAGTAAEAGAISGSSSDSGDHTPGSSKIQAEAKAAPGKLDPVGAAMLARMHAIDALLEEKERQVLKFVYEKVPKPYYERWKGEANAAFALRVRLKARIADRRR